MIGAIQKPLIRGLGRAAMDSARGYYDYAIPWYASYTTLTYSLVLDLPAPLTAPKNRTSILDISGKGNDGVITGAQFTQNTRGIYDIEFDRSDDVINCGNGASLDITSQITLLAWVNFNSVASDQFIMGRDDATNRNYYLKFLTADKQLYMVIFIGGAAKIATSIGVLAAGRWYLLGGIYTGSTIQTYINGVEDGAGVSQTGSIDNDDVPLTIGEMNNGSDPLGAKGNAFRVLNRGLRTYEMKMIFEHERSYYGV